MTTFSTKSDGARVVPPVWLSWPALLGGATVSLGVTVLLLAAGLAAGLTAVDPANPGSARPAGIATSVWTLVVPLVALFVGGLVVARVAGPFDRASGILHGAVLWGLSSFVGVLTLSWMLAGVGGVAARASGDALGAARHGAAMLQASGESAGPLGVGDEELAPANQRLRAEGKAQVTGRQIDGAAREVVARAVRSGRLDRDAFVASVTSRTELSRAEATDLAARVEEAVQRRRADVGHEVETAALEAADATGAAMAWVSLSLFLGLVAAMAGATVGVARRQRTITPVGSTG